MVDHINFICITLVYDRSREQDSRPWIHYYIINTHHVHVHTPRKPNSIPLQFLSRTLKYHPPLSKPSKVQRLFLLTEFSDLATH